MLLLQDTQIETITFRQSDGGLLVTQDEDILVTGSESFSIGISDMGNIEGSEMFFHVHEGTNTTNVVTSGQVDKFSGFVLEPGGNFTLAEIVLEGISDFDFGVRESDGPTIMGNNVWDFVGANSSSLDFQKFELCFGVFDGNQSESPFNIIEHSIVLIGFGYGKDIHNTNREPSISSNFIVNLESSIFIHNSKSNLTTSKCKIQSFSKPINLSYT